MAQTPTGAVQYRNINASGTTTVKTGPGVLVSVTINNKGAGGHTITLYDNTAGSGTKIATIDGTANQVTLFYNVGFTNGLTIVTSAGSAADITVAYA